MKNKLFILTLGFIIGGVTFSVFYLKSDYNNKSSQIQDKEIEEIAKLSGVSKFAEKLPNKLHTIVGESGIKLIWRLNLNK